VARNPKATKKDRQDRRPKPTSAGGRPRRGRPKVCIFCAGHATWVDYKDVALLRRFINDRGRIKSRGATGTCAQHQRDVATAVKTARELALLPYTVRTAATESRGSRGGDRRGDGTEGTRRDVSGPETSDSPSAATLESDGTESAVADEVTDQVTAPP
jgi:small subunit ribosomal protein S18